MLLISVGFDVSPTALSPLLTALQPDNIIEAASKEQTTGIINVFFMVFLFNKTCVNASSR
ncbi:hypothetical protein BBM0121_06145 [Bifidobacterium breve MCC 0121]|nr:hypothetical protein BBM1094_04160 [Bifidobacterium breve MCC 1094]KOA43919.1 hypothetical protein BBM0121_06145 [Bifidobacterium breve MCC 0121]KOA51983.1 hypothetical protein BBM1340_03130 [Bifidobacterium breve MCC 1340]KOA58975.1 hypothetical protein BBM1604_06890 [Bifidobacterium breve MCC 1604]